MLLLASVNRLFQVCEEVLLFRHSLETAVDLPLVVAAYPFELKPLKRWLPQDLLDVLFCYLDFFSYLIRWDLKDKPQDMVTVWRGIEVLIPQGLTVLVAVVLAPEVKGVLHEHGLVPRWQVFFP